MDCRPHCAACCIAPSISSPLPGLPDGKPAGVPCPHLDPDLRCRLFGSPERPRVCTDLKPCPEMCGTHAAQAMNMLTRLEADTAAPVSRNERDHRNPLPRSEPNPPRR
ncbi:MAG: YkgJ family cysteine cluster protein [Gammaproteobacteria bacterium]